MKITSVELHPDGSSDVCALSFRDPRRLNPYNVKAIVGLDAEEIVPRYYGASGGSKYYNLSLESRDLVVRVELNPNFSANQTYSTLRDTLYKMIASSRTGIVEVQFKNGTEIIAVVSGYVSKLEAPHFNKNPEVQITINCSDPLLRAPNPVLVDLTGLDPLNTVIEDSLSTAPHGLTFDIEVRGARPSFEIRDVDHATDYSWKFTVAPVGGLLVGDVIHLSSEHNNKAIYLTRSGNIIYLADVVAPGSIWPLIFPGTNSFSVATGTPDYIWRLISHRPAYWGV